MWDYLATNTQHFMERGEMKCLGCLNLDLLFLTVNTWFYAVKQSYSVTQIQNFVISVDTYSTKHKTSLLGELCSELFCFFIFQPWNINRCLELGQSMLVHLTNTNSPFFFFFHSIYTNPSWERQKNNFEVFFPYNQNCIRVLFNVWGLLWFFFVLGYLLGVHIFAVPLNLQAVAWLLEVLCCSWKII